jgi:hypothetical protein
MQWGPERSPLGAPLPVALMQHILLAFAFCDVADYSDYIFIPALVLVQAFLRYNNMLLPLRYGNLLLVDIFLFGFNDDFVFFPKYVNLFLGRKS